MTVLYVTLSGLGTTPSPCGSSSMPRNTRSARIGSPSLPNAAATRLNAMSSTPSCRPLRWPLLWPRGKRREAPRAALDPPLCPPLCTPRRSCPILRRVDSTDSSKSRWAPMGSPASQYALTMAVHARRVGSHPKPPNPTRIASYMCSRSSLLYPRAEDEPFSWSSAARLASHSATAPAASPARSKASNVNSKSSGTGATPAPRRFSSVRDATSGSPATAATCSDALAAAAARALTSTSPTKFSDATTASATDAAAACIGDMRRPPSPPPLSIALYRAL
mmetsp:Transcript_1422/g.6357  ORF Transcript_1422/g.6357 Transcript_1422/m.6357 type:complete len:278 (+) Transcript_1422:1368-2201(+)